MFRTNEPCFLCIVCASECSWNRHGRKAVMSALRNYATTGDFLISLGLIPSDVVFSGHHDMCGGCLSVIITCDNLLNAFWSKVDLLKTWLTRDRVFAYIPSVSSQPVQLVVSQHGPADGNSEVPSITDIPACPPITKSRKRKVGEISADHTPPDHRCCQDEHPIREELERKDAVEIEPSVEHESAIIREPEVNGSPECHVEEPRTNHAETRRTLEDKDAPVVATEPPLPDAVADIDEGETPFRDIELNPNDSSSEGSENEPEFADDENTNGFEGNATKWKPLQRKVSKLEKVVRAPYGNRLMICLECEARHATTVDLYWHYRNHHSIPGGELCEDCGRSFASSEAYDAHMHDHWMEVKDTVACIDCRRTVRTSLFQKHLVHAHGGNPSRTWAEREKNGRKYFRCTECSYFCVAILWLGKHVAQAHGQEECFRCNQCPAKFKARRTLNRHRSKKHQGQIFACDECPKTFPCHEYLWSHKRFHIDPKCLHTLCPDCGKSMVKYQLPNHMARVHGKGEVGVKAFECDLCQSSFEHKSYRKKHLFRVHGVGEYCERKVFSCEDCGKEFRDKCYFVAHAFSVHGKRLPGVKEHACPHCFKVFALKAVMVKHLAKVHSVFATSDAEPFKCNICSRNLPERQSFLDHLQGEHGVIAKVSDFKDYLANESEAGRLRME